MAYFNKIWSFLIYCFPDIININLMNNIFLKIKGGLLMAKVKGTNKRTRPKRSYKKPGSKKGRGVRQTWKK